MGLEDRAKCWCWGPEPSCWEAGSDPTRGRGGPLSLCGHTVGQYTSGALSGEGQDHIDGQILGQPRPLSGQEEEEEGARATPAARPAFPGMGSEELRLASFCDWPLTAMVRPERLAAAGFFYTGQQDKVRCFFCCGGLQSWEQGDDPWTEHAEWFPRSCLQNSLPSKGLTLRDPQLPAAGPCGGTRLARGALLQPKPHHGASQPASFRCEFLLQTRGQDFVRSVQEARCHPLCSWDQPEKPEDGSPAVPSGAGDSQEWSARCQCPAVQAVLRMGFGPDRVRNLLQRKYSWAGPADLSASWLVADLLQEDDGDRGLGTRGPELPTPRREAQSEGARESGAGDAGEQLRRLQEERTCKVCLDRTVDTVFVPCGHLVCAECAPALQLCPVCRAPVRSCVRTFLS
ncbi:baculoviral IAP repeat-containing protein 7 isoform X1 [Mustela erminea]|uniref:baculoviral IAP repeat-containing protein 7 isoform X1 n=1 Tax=Mustela erminea TaxID=36723 RepID=UPI00138728CA|nr:baculoviral IAP repeat-containing protein 7 isoform X1 [Mustela erminea]XP_032209457.1 baculoviral IAP repeat-containing protein 7 isoform X1 [Mustela erminea]